MSAHTPAAQAAMSAVRLICSCSSCGKVTTVGMSDCREHGVGVLTFRSEWAGHPVTVSYTMDEDGPELWRVTVGNTSISGIADNFSEAQVDVWLAEALLDADRRERMQQEDMAADAVVWA